MKTIEIYRNQYRERSKIAEYPHREIISCISELEQACQYDHITAQCTNNHRGKEDFKSCNVIHMDLDNTHSEDCDSWMTLDDIAEAFPDVCFYYIKSRNHMKPKTQNGKMQEPREKYHIYFPLSAQISGYDTAKRVRSFICCMFPYFDKECLDPVHFFFGVENASGGEYDGTLCIDQYLQTFGTKLPELCKKRVEEYDKLGYSNINELKSFLGITTQKAVKQTIISPEIIPVKQRNHTLNRLACSLQSKGLSDEAIYSAIMTENKQKCSPPLDDEEVETLVKSALRYPKGMTPAEERRIEEGFQSLMEYRKSQKIEEIDEDGAKKYRKEHVRNGKKSVEEVNEEDLELPDLEEIEEKEIKWLINKAIPKECITIISSDGGIGKTSLCCDIVAKLSKGEKTILEMTGTQYDNIPFGTAINSALYFSKEDPTDSILKPKLRAAGANISKIKCIGVDFPKINDIWYGSLYLEKLIEKYRPEIVVFDTLQSFLPDFISVDMAKRRDIRDSLTPLNMLGAKYGTAFIIVSHTNKSNNAGRNRIADSSDIWDIARSVYIAGKTRDNGIYYLSHEKSNYGALRRTILFSHTDDNRIKFEGLTGKKDEDFQSEGQMVYASPKKDEAKAFILEQLEESEKIEINEIERIGKAAGISTSTLQEARSELVRDKIVVRKCEGYGPTKKWYLYCNAKATPSK